MDKSPGKENPTLRSEFWGICCESGKKYSQVVRKKFHISMAALDPTVVPTSSCVSLMVERAGCQYLLCSLKPDSVLQVNLNLFFDKGEKVTFSLKGHGTIHLSGYHILNENELSPPESFNKGKAVAKPRFNISAASKESEEESSESDSEEGDKKAKVASPAKKLSATPSIMPLKKGNQAAKAQPKAESEEDSSEEDESEEDHDTKNELPKKGKLKLPKLSVVLFRPKKEGELSGISEESAEDMGSSKGSEGEEFRKDAKMVKIYSQKRLHTSNESQESEEEDSSEEDSSDESAEDKLGMLRKAAQDFQTKKRMKTEASTPVMKGKPNQKTPNKFAEVISLDDDDSKTNNQLNSSIGRTPMPKKSAASILQQKNALNESLGSKKKTQPMKTSSKDEESSDSDSETDELNSSAGAALSPKKALTQGSPAEVPNQTASPKKKKKKKKSKVKMNDSGLNEGAPNKANESFSKPTLGKSLPGGLQVEDVRAGNGPVAKKGKMVHVYYTGKLDNNTVFDSCKPGGKPFSFRLGAGMVIKGWDQGLEGMKVGGKRRIRIPPQLGYEHKRMGKIPPNSTLHFDVELKAVS